MAKHTALREEKIVARREYRERIEEKIEALKRSMAESRKRIIKLEKQERGESMREKLSRILFGRWGPRTRRWWITGVTVQAAGVILLIVALIAEWRTGADLWQIAMVAGGILVTIGTKLRRD